MSDQPLPMTVHELVEALRQLAPDKPIVLEGCDCAEYLGAVLDEEERVFLQRVDSGNQT